LLEKQSEIKSQIGYRTLDKPIHHGYNAYFTLREDIAKRDDRLSWLTNILSIIFQHNLGLGL
jgi:hypothetical protein